MLTTSPLPTTDRGPATNDSTNANPALLFVPGWCGDRSVMDALVNGCSVHRRAVSVDLPGHGDSPDSADYSSSDLVDRLTQTIDAAGLDTLVPVTLSHAGWAGIELRRRLGDRVPGLVFLDWMVLGTPPGFTDALAGLQSPGWAGVRGALQDMWTAGLDIPALSDYVAAMGDYGQAHWARAGREISAGFAAEPVPLAAVAALQPCPVLHLYAQPADDALLQAQEAYAEAHPWFTVHRLNARSHFPMFEVPDAMVARIEEFVSCGRIPA